MTEREYWAQRKGQAALDEVNAPILADGLTPRVTKFETDKAKLRRMIRNALEKAGSFDEFASLLLREGVTVRESRGRLSYLTPDRTKPITARKLGDDFDRAAVLAALEQNRAKDTGKKENPFQTQEEGLQRLVDREAKRAEGKGRWTSGGRPFSADRSGAETGYDRWATKHNLQQMSKPEPKHRKEQDYER